jgi:hypothetical protein
MLIDGFPELTDIQDEDLLLIERPGASPQYFRFKVATLKKLLGSSSSSQQGNTQQSSTILTFQANGDSQGVFYFLGKRNRSQWVNPLLAGEIAITIFPPYDASHNNPDYLCDRIINSRIATANQIGSYYLIDLKDYRLKINHYSLRARDYYANNPSNWQFQGSSDFQDWITLDNQVNQNLQQNQWFDAAVQASVPYRYFRVISTGASSSGDNIFCMAELELYGELFANGL